MWMDGSVGSGAGKFKQLRHFTAAAALALGLVGCAGAPLRSAPKTIATPQPLAQLTVATPDADHDVVAQLLAGEMALTRTDLKAASSHYDKAMALSNDPKVAERAAGLAIAVHDAAAAGRALERWQALGAKPGALAQARAELALDRGDSVEARRQLELLVGTGDKDAWRQFGRVLVGARDQAQAGRLLEALATPQRLPGDAHAWLAMSELGDRLGRHAYAVQIADAAMQRFKSAETYAWAAQMKFKDGDRDGARALLQKALAKEPKNVQLRLAYAGLLGQAGDYAGAGQLLARGPQDADTYAMRAGLAAHEQDGKALAALYQELQKAPPDVRASSAYLLGQLAEMQHREAEALAWYDQVGDADEHAFDADLRSAMILHTQGKRAEAHELLGQLQLAYLDQPEQLRQAWQADAELYLREQNYAKAEAAFSHALQVVPDDPGLLYGRGLAYAEAGQIDQAVQDFERLLKIKPGDVDASNALGYTLADANRDLPEAERLISAARAAKPDDPAIADSWGWLQYRMGNLDQAAQVLRGAWLARKDADVGVHLGEVLWKQGHRRDAQRIFDEVRKLDPHNGALQETLKRLHP
ncbi:tetratricopeptide repeat protein [Rhodanobacter sp. KK11]|uniref:tetratricopeptide repeat protein n=1 Tax=Rhodanobacter sp. KK11 TaxID=3083255 RepID=UPI002966CA3C|nr:tetratricopeptide repeat protein [Rhodanobacter sp. KK11]MDW2980628.1 tetratricopeptide repeat protein [Rhodanobacter sp. KK11]